MCCSAQHARAPHSVVCSQSVLTLWREEDERRFVQPWLGRTECARPETQRRVRLVGRSGSSHAFEGVTCRPSTRRSYPAHRAGRKRSDGRAHIFSNVLRQVQASSSVIRFTAYPSYWSSQRPFRIATDKMRMAATMNSLRFVARSFGVAARLPGRPAIFETLIDDRFVNWFW